MNQKAFTARSIATMIVSMSGMERDPPCSINPGRAGSMLDPISVTFDDRSLIGQTQPVLEKDTAISRPTPYLLLLNDDEPSSV